MIKNIGIVGLGLIGGSLAKAIKKNTKHTVFGFDINSNVVKSALEDQNIDEVLNDNTIKKCNMILLALYPNDTINYVKENLNKLPKNIVIVDCAGTKKHVCDEITPLAKENGFYFVGGHPMAGIERSGYKYSFAEMYEGATMILCREKDTNLIAMKAIELLFLEIGFGRVTITDALEHDRIIAFTSQLAHIVSNAYVKSPSAKMQMGFSAGSYKDLTRVARLNEKMWTELFFENKENLIFETECIIMNLQQYLDALKNNDAETLCQLLKEGREAKETIG